MEQSEKLFDKELNNIDQQNEKDKMGLGIIKEESHVGGINTTKRIGTAYS